MLMVNSKVSTPLGQGIIQGAYAVMDGKGEPIVKGAAVRLPINETTRPQLNKSNCLTPKAMKSGLWVFPESELK